VKKFSIASFFLIASVLSYCLALALPAYFTDIRNGFGESGLLLLLVGWIGAPIQWLANPFMVTGFVFYLYKKRVASVIFFTISAFLMLSFLGVHSVLCNEAGRVCQIIKLGLGYWLWLISAGCAIAASATMGTNNSYGRAPEKSLTV
jgi:hypothetical protein